MKALKKQHKTNTHTQTTNKKQTKQNDQKTTKAAATPTKTANNKNWMLTKRVHETHNIVRAPICPQKGRTISQKGPLLLIRFRAKLVCLNLSFHVCRACGGHAASGGSGSVPLARLPQTHIIACALGHSFQARGALQFRAAPIAVPKKGPLHGVATNVAKAPLKKLDQRSLLFFSWCSSWLAHPAICVPNSKRPK